LVEALLKQIKTDEVLPDQLGQGKIQQSDEHGVIRIETPLLQMVLTRLWDEEMQHGSHSLQLSTLIRLGGAENIVRTHLDKEMEELDENGRDAAARMFRFLVTSSGAKIAQDPTSLADWADITVARARAVLEQLSGKKRVLRMVSAPGEPDRYEIFHDILAPAVLDWRTRYTQAQTKAETEKRLAQARQRVARLRFGVAALALLLVGVVALAVWARSEQQRALSAQLINRSREIAASALFQLDFDPDLSLLLAMEAIKLAETEQAKYALRESLIESRVRTVMRGHDKDVLTAAFSSDGKLAVTASSDKTARVWDAATGQEMARLPHDEEVIGAAFVPDKNQVVITMSGTTVYVWNTTAPKDPRREKTLAHERKVKTAYFSPDGRLLVTTSENETATWETDTWRQVWRQDSQNEATKSAYFSLDNQLVVAAVGKTARIWDAKTGRPVGKPFDHPALVTEAVFSPDGKFLATASDDWSAWIWEVSTGKRLFQLRGHTGAIIYVVFPTHEYDPDKLLLATVSMDNTIRIWDAKNGSQRAELRGHVAEISDAIFSHNGKYLVTASNDGTVLLWDAVTGTNVWKFVGHSDTVNSVTFSPDNKSVITASADRTARIWDAAAWFSLGELEGHAAAINRVALSADDKWLMTASDDQTSRVWDIGAWLKSLDLSGHGEEMKRSQVLKHEGEVLSVAFNSESTLAATACEDRTTETASGLPSGVIHVWEAGTWKEKIRPIKTERRVTSVSFIPRSQFIAAASGERVQIWDVKTGQAVFQTKPLAQGEKPPADEQSVESIYIKSVTCSPDGKFLLAITQQGFILTWSITRDAPGKLSLTPYQTTTQNSAMAIWEAETKNKMPALGGRAESAESIVFSALGKYFAVSHDQTARVWEANAWHSKAVLRGHPEPVLYAAFGPHDELLVTTSSDKTVRLWDINTSQSLIVLRGHTQGVSSAIFSHDGKFIVTAGKDGLVRIYRCEECGSIDDLRALANQRRLKTNREFTLGERERFLHDLIDQNRER